MTRIVTLALAASAVCWSASTQTWELADYQDFLSGDFQQVSLDENGRLTLAPRVETVFQSEEAVFWSVAEGRDGSVYVGSGHRGKLFRIAPDGQAKELWQAPEIEIFALTVGDRGELYAGTSPSGKVYRLNSAGEAEEFFDPQEEYIWSLLKGPDGLYVGTGGEGKIYRVESKGRGAVYFDSGQRHVISLALDSEGRVLAGADPNGVLYRLTGRGQAFALYDADLPEIRAIQAEPSGTVLFAAMGGAVSLSDQATQAVQSAATISVTATAQGGSHPVLGAQQSVSTQTPAAPISQPVVSYAVETSAVFRLEPDAAVEKLWTSREENALGLAKRGAQIVFGTDKGGRVLAINEARRPTLLTASREGRLAGLAPSRSGLLMVAAHPAELRRLAPSTVSEGVYTTGVRDAGSIARWGQLSWTGQGTVEFQTRSGNVAQPDKSWSDWSEPLKASSAAVASPPARYIQWRSKLKAGGRPPFVESVRIAYLPQNQPPVISSVAVDPIAADESGNANSSGSNNGSNGSSAYSITVTASADGTSGVSSAGSTAEKKIRRPAHSALAVSWSAEDPDDSELLARVEFRGEGETAWKTLEADVSKKLVRLDGESLADGRYRFRVTVSDARSNPPGAERTASMTSQPVLIDHTPPLVRVLSQSPTGARFAAEDGASPLVSSEYSIDAGPWRPVLPEDGVADSIRETIVVRDLRLESREHLLTLRVRDAAGNAGLAKAILRR